jgi:putative FmdB family regulatory protein
VPSYTYQCKKCEARVEKIISLEEFDKARPRCPECKGGMKHVMFAPAIHMRYSHMHPRHHRGQKGKFKIQKGSVME